MLDYKQEEKQMEYIGDLLTKLKKKIIYFDLTYAKGEKHPAILTTYQFDEKDFEVLIRAVSVKDLGDYINMRCCVFDTYNLESEIKNKLYKLCLELNYFLPETTFSAFQDSIYIEADMPLKVKLKDFKFELRGLTLGLENLAEHIKVFGLELADTKGKMEIDYSNLDITWT